MIDRGFRIYCRTMSLTRIISDFVVTPGVVVLKIPGTSMTLRWLSSGPWISKRRILAENVSHRPRIEIVPYMNEPSTESARCTLYAWKDPLSYISHHGFELRLIQGLDVTYALVWVVIVVSPWCEDNGSPNSSFGQGRISAEYNLGRNRVHKPALWGNFNFVNPSRTELFPLDWSPTTTNCYVHLSHLLLRIYSTRASTCLFRPDC